jgi:hypothetical protein
MMRLDEFRPHLFAVLEEQPDRHWLTLSIWHRFQECFQDEARRLRANCRAKPGKNGGDGWSPLTYIAHSLAAMPEQVDCSKLHVQGVGPITVHDDQVSDEQHPAIFRWIGSG